MDDEQLKRGAWAGIAAFQRLIGTHAPDARLTESDHYVASAVPSVPSSLINAAVPVGGGSLAPHLDEIDAFYADSRKWGAWIDPENATDAEALTQQGLVLDSRPVLMAAELSGIEGSVPDLKIERVSMAEVGAVNDRAYENARAVIESALAGFPAGGVHRYALRVDGEIACAALIIDVGADAFVTFVATLPHHRGKRLASNLLRHALSEAKRRGQQTTSLQASKLGQGIYARLGYRPLGEAHLYETRQP